MKAQAYYDNPRDMIVRIFAADSSYGIADLPLSEATAEAADAALGKLRLRRNGPWRQMPWGREARIHFANDKSEGSAPLKTPEAERTTK